MKVNSLILLINSLSKSEKKAIILQSNLTKGLKLYLGLFNLIENEKIVDAKQLSDEFGRKFSKESFHPVVKYLYEFILTTISKLRMSKDKEFIIYQGIINAKILKERNLNEEYFFELQKLKKGAKVINNYHLLLTLRRMELDFIHTIGYFNFSEKELLRKQHNLSETLKTIRQINEQSSLYELLELRIEKTPISQIASQKQFLNDLVVSEISLVSNLRKEIFEIQKLHKLFQAKYFIYVGDYKSAFNSFIELDKLFEKNIMLWKDSPIYYLNVLEGILESLKGIGKYSKMEYFLEKLNLIEDKSVNIQTELICIEFIYKVSVILSKNNPQEALNLISEYKIKLIEKKEILNPLRQMQLSLNLSIIYFHNRDYNRAKKKLLYILNNNSFSDIWLFKPIQLLKLIIDYILNDLDFMTSTIRSIKRQNKLSKKSSNIENVLFHFLSLDSVPLSKVKKDDLKEKYQKELSEISKNYIDKHLQSVFDFEKWILTQFR